MKYFLYLLKHSRYFVKKTTFLPALLLFSISYPPAALAALETVTVQGADGAAITDYRWLIEEDKTYHVPLNADGSVKMNAGIPAIDPNWRTGDPNRNTISVNFFHSYMPVIAKGLAGEPFPLACGVQAAGKPCLDANKNYFISILPAAGYSMGGASIKAGQKSATIHVNKTPTPTAQITVFVHSDIAPINGAWDQGEQGLANFSIILEDAGGKYGASAGTQSQDAFGNPLCTTYQYTDNDGNGQHDSGEPFVADPTTGSPVVASLGAGCKTGPDGRVTIRNLAPGKYGVMTVPPNAVETPPRSGNYFSNHWIQTTTIEGTKTIDTLVRANEPAFFEKIGQPAPHISIGFVPAGRNKPYIDHSILSGGTTVDGQVVNLHLSAPPDPTFHSGGSFKHTIPWIGLNQGAVGEGKGIYAARANEDGTFSIPNVPPGNYQMVVWDDNLDLLFTKNKLVVKPDGSCNESDNCSLGDIPVFQWFFRMEHHVFNDQNENGKRDAGEQPIPEQTINLRFRDGTVYQTFPTDLEGIAPFDEVFPFYSWLVSEVDFGRFKATGMTAFVDDGGPIAFGDPRTFDRALNPQQQANGALSRTETGPVLTQAFQGFLGQTNVIQWGKTAYAPGENGGISGVVMYAVTRAEDNPELAIAEPWEPGIPGVTVNLYDSTGQTRLATTLTDSWDNSIPTGCATGANRGRYILRGQTTDCFDGQKVWNQVRPGVFDGGYLFDSICEGGLAPDGNCAAGMTSPIPPQQYLVEVVPPHGYEVIKSQDRNVDFGDEFFPSPELLPPTCAGNDYVVPAELSLFPGEPAPLAGHTLKNCDRKLINLANGANAVVDFSLFTEVPVAGHLIGTIFDDTANQTDPASPHFGDKYAPPFLPVSIRDYTGREITRTVSDEFGTYNAMVPSTITGNLPQPSGISPNMLTSCVNAKTRPDGSPDPLHKPQYNQFCFNFQYVPGSTTYLNTPVLPVAAFAAVDMKPVDCQPIDATPRIHSVDITSGENAAGGPYIPTKPRYAASPETRRTRGAQTITIRSIGQQPVPNPDYKGIAGATAKTITRDYGFGNTQGEVTLGNITFDAGIVDWSDNEIIVHLPADYPLPGPAEGRQLAVKRGDNGVATPTGVTVQVGLRPGSKVIPVTPGAGAIQAAIDSAGANDLILIAPGTYHEWVIMWKPVQLQGWGEGSVTINATRTLTEQQTAWRRKIRSLSPGHGNNITLAPGQANGFGGIVPGAFFAEEGAGILVVANAAGEKHFKKPRNKGARIDGLTITGANSGGGIVVNAHADDLDISNLRISQNNAYFAGGIRVGHPFYVVNRNGERVYSDASNERVRIHHNTITQNSGVAGAGGGLALHTGSHQYAVSNNFICGNFTSSGGAGIAHFGLSRNAQISNNTVLFNENFNQATTVHGGGILVSGLPAIGCPFGPYGNQNPACLANPQRQLSPGSGSVSISNNLIQGNSSGVGDGAGIRLNRINGQDAATSPSGTYVIDLTNNIIANNVAALSGGGISIQDALAVNISQNTIVNNDAASTGGDAFTAGIPDKSVAQAGAGIITHPHSPALSAVLPSANNIANATMQNNIIWHNRQFSWSSDLTQTPAVNGLCPDINSSEGLPCPAGNVPVYDDLSVGSQACVNCILTGSGGPAPEFVAEYINANRDATTLSAANSTAIQAPPAFDAGGNFIRLRYGPLTQTDTATGALLGNYKLLNPPATGGAAPGAVITTD